MTGEEIPPPPDRIEIVQGLRAQQRAAGCTCSDPFPTVEMEEDVRRVADGYAGAAVVTHQEDCAIRPETEDPPTSPFSPAVQSALALLSSALGCRCVVEVRGGYLREIGSHRFQFTHQPGCPVHARAAAPLN